MWSCGEKKELLTVKKKKKISTGNWAGAALLQHTGAEEERWVSPCWRHRSYLFGERREEREEEEEEVRKKTKDHEHTVHPHQGRPGHVDTPSMHSIH